MRDRGLCTRPTAPELPSFEDTTWTFLCQVTVTWLFSREGAEHPLNGSSACLSTICSYGLGARIMISSMELSSNSR